jgi:hypothetical protein
LSLSRTGIFNLPCFVFHSLPTSVEVLQMHPNHPQDETCSGRKFPALPLHQVDRSLPCGMKNIVKLCKDDVKFRKDGFIRGARFQGLICRKEAAEGVNEPTNIGGCHRVGLRKHLPRLSGAGSQDKSRLIGRLTLRPGVGDNLTHYYGVINQRRLE